MSASDKKKLRKELNAASMTEKQQAEQKKQKKLKITTTTFIVVMILVVALVLSSILITPISRAIVNNTVAAKVNDHQISADELNYYYHDAINNFYSNFSDYGDYQDLYLQMYTGLVPSKTLDEQVYNSETGDTWADYFIDAAIENAKWVYAMCDAADAAGYELTEEQLSSISSIETYMALYAYYYGYSSAEAYIRAIYGTAASLDSYMEYYTMCQTASYYANAYVEGLEYTVDDYRTFEADKMNEFSSYSWYSYYLKASDYLTFLELGTTVTDDEGKESITYSDEDNQTAADAAKADAEALANGLVSSLEDLNTAINALAINKDSKTELSATEYTKRLYANAEYYTPNEDALNWLTSADRAEGDMTVVAYTTTDSEGNETVKGYYVLYFVDSNDNAAVNVGTVRHLLVAFEEDDDGNVTDEAKAAAKATAEELLAEYLAGELTETAFTALIKEHSDDTEDGLYEDVTPDSGYVTEFSDWATADHEVGDVEIIETTYGYHIMYYVSCSELSYRDTMIDTEMKNEAYSEWEENEILEGYSTEELNLKHIDRDFIING